MTKLRHWLPWLLGTLTLAYLVPMCVRDYSWVFISSDSGDWLASSIKWMVPQTTGAPIYILLGHLMNTLFSTHLPVAMSIGLSAIPTSVTVVFTYLIVRRLTGRELVAFTSALVLAGSAVIITQATTIGYHMLAVTFLVIAFYCYIREWRYRTALFLAFSLAVHILALPIALFWLLADRRFRMWFKPILLFIGVTALFYSLVLLLMYLPTPRFLAGGLNLVAMKGYFTATSKAIVGQLSIFETPARLWFGLKLLLLSFGVALIPIAYALKRPLSRPVIVVLGTALFVWWYFITCVDVMAWTQTSFAIPFLVILAGLGLAKLTKQHTWIVVSYACIILILNPIFMNANTINNQDPQGRQFLNQLEALPKNSVVVANAGAQSLGIFYTINLDRPDLLPLIHPYLDTSGNYLSSDYANYLKSHFDATLDYTTTLSAVQSALNEGRAVYYTDYYGELSGVLLPCFNLSPGPHRSVRQVLSLTGKQPNATVVMK